MRARRAGRASRGLAGLLLALLALSSWPLLSPRVSGAREEGLLVLSVVSLLLASGSLLGEALGVASAAVELVLGVAAGIAGIRSVEPLELLALIGSVFIMYVAGLEVDPSLLRRYLVKSVLGGLASFAAPAVSVYLVLAALGVGPLEAAYASVGVSTTSVAVVYAIVRRTGLSRRPVGQVIIAVAMAADIASILAFAALAAGPSPVLALYFTGLAVFVWVMARFLEWASGGENEVELRLILAFLLAASFVSEYAGVHAILFAFLLGVATRRTVLGDRSLEGKVAGLTFGFLAPLFFVNAGIHGAPSNPVLYTEEALLLLAASYPVKVASSHAVLRLISPRRPPLRLSTVMGARLTVSTIIAYEGEAAGILPHDLAGAVIVSALAATVLSAVLSGTAIPEQA